MSIRTMRTVPTRGKQRQIGHESSGGPENLSAARRREERGGEERGGEMGCL